MQRRQEHDFLEASFSAEAEPLFYKDALLSSSSRRRRRRRRRRSHQYRYS
jgi:hypothetical protein